MPSRRVDLLPDRSRAFFVAAREPGGTRDRFVFLKGFLMPLLSRGALGRLVDFGAAVVLSTLATSTGWAQGFPDKPITLYVGFAPGGSADVIARVLPDEKSKTLGQTVIVDNRSSASGNIATSQVLQRPADGHSLLFAGIHLATNPGVIGVPFDPKTELQMVSQVTSVPVVLLASNKSGIKSLADAMALARKREGGLSAGSGGTATSSHLALELMKQSTGIPAVHVPYRGGAPATQDLSTGVLDLKFDMLNSGMIPLAEARRVSPLVVM